MALFRNPKLDQMETKYFNGFHFQEGGHQFTLTLAAILPNPKNILEYDWKVTLPSGIEFTVKMGPVNLGYPSTRLEWIIDELKKRDIYEYDFLANAINDKIDKIYRDYKN
ncbi:hypothetical protein [Paenibacillus radicis (ex Xue et al. 2023)]|uniref:Uncharacterized protein n=1 Tax=Paenibacillus radicis (ex Xue et al. 2023) TaxID=2972489 RepID=A0ABT1YV28_9BACL|nr:hypothetical protein [Paenibacillus radicis (ex Xue et al. 2023)]MCR8636787.1 hypothetical protein [Paenibacillus radicis (ex Xue et al. 2023)]